MNKLRTLGRSGLVVSPLALGTMTFGAARWGSADDVSRAVFDGYTEAGGNFIDTADVYAGGHSEELIGQYVAERKLRDQIVLATKFGFQGGNGRKSIHRALEGSLRRLQSDYIDLYWLHIWDTVTPVEEVLQTFDDLRRAGKIRYFGLSNVPAWYAARMATLATTGPIALQMEYSLVARDMEREHVPAAQECGLGVCAWSPLAGGFLTGKYSREGGEGRLRGSNPFGDSKFTERNWQTLEALREVAAEIGRPPAQVALAWASSQPAIASVVIGASNATQLRDNLASLAITLTADQTARLNAMSAHEQPGSLPWTKISRMVFGGQSVSGWRPTR